MYPASVNQDDPRALAAHTDRVRRRMLSCKGGVSIAEFAGGWLTVKAGDETAQVPSESSSRVYWLAAEQSLRTGDLAAARDAAVSLGGRRLFAWIAPRACDARDVRCRSTEIAEVSEDGKAWRVHHEDKYVRQAVIPATER